MILALVIFLAAAAISAYGFGKIDATPNAPQFTWPSFQEKKVTMNRYKLVCRNKAMEEVFTIEGYKTELEAQDMIDILLEGRRESDCTWYIEPLRYN
jgi:hypothetical protein